MYPLKPFKPPTSLSSLFIDADILL